MDSMRIDGGKIVKLREDKGYSQAELARLLGIKQPSLWQIEHNRRKTLKSSTLTALCDVLSTTPDYLLSDDTLESVIDRELVAMESELIATLRKLSPDKRVALMEYARFLRSEQGDKAGPAGKRQGNVHAMNKSKPAAR